MLVFRAGAGSRPASDSLSFASPKESKQRKGDPQSATPSRSEGADLRRGGCVVRRGTRFAAAQRRSDRRGESDHEARALRRACHPETAPAQAQPEGVGCRTATRVFAALDPAWAAPGASGGAQREAPAPANWGRAKQWPEWMPASPSPLCAPRSAGRGAACAEGHTLRGLTRCGCLSGAPQARSEFRSAPHARAPQVAPAHSAGDADSGVALSLVTFFRRRERKLLARRATPGLRLVPNHAARCAGRLQQAQPERIG